MYKFKIESMNCMSCFHNINDALTEFDAKISAKADIKNKTIEVESNQPVEKLVKLIEEAGYPVKELPK
ncbi:MAG: heavy-metal-associated domain-containing protein [Bacteriovoracaceae bacterium]